MCTAPGSAKGSVPAGSVGVLSAVLWLPDALNVMGSSIIEKEEDSIHAGGLQRCLESLHRQTFGACCIAQQKIFSEASLIEVPFSQHSIDFIERRCSASRLKYFGLCWLVQTQPLLRNSSSAVSIASF